MKGPITDLDSVSGRPSWAGAATRAGSRLWFTDATRHAMGTQSAALHTRELVQTAYRQALMSNGVFQGQVGNLGAGAL